MQEKDRQLFEGAYCGLCHVLGRQYGWTSRLFLNYDFVFLAILLSPPDEPPCREQRCIAHHWKRECVLASCEALELAAAESVILAWWQLQDGIADSGALRGMKYRFASRLLRRAYGKAQREQPSFDAVTRRNLARLAELERSNSPSLDETADAFAQILCAAADALPEPRRRRVVGQMLYHLGRWVYLVDAADDLEKDLRCGSYNPLPLRYSLTEGKLAGEERESFAQTLDASVRRMAAAFELVEFGVWHDLLERIVYQSLYQVGGAVLDGSFHKSRKKESKKEETR